MPTYLVRYEFKLDAKDPDELNDRTSSVFGAIAALLPNFDADPDWANRINVEFLHENEAGNYHNAYTCHEREES